MIIVSICVILKLDVNFKFYIKQGKYWFENNVIFFNSGFLKFYSKQENVK